ncbi:RICIN domain-containing protein [Streptomyces alboflavus]|uniref:RICIN domain-containing protein n=1 Tax=Streptomyces alboflavus TaxID=67267 RepID=UPI003680FBCA
MSDLQLPSGIYIIGAHIGFRTVLTPTPHSVSHGRPVIAAPELIPPIVQEWLIERAGDLLPGQYHIRPAHGPSDQYLNYTDEGAFVRNGSPVPWRIQPTPFGIQIVSDKDLVLRTEHVGAQVRLAPEDDSPNEAWTLHQLR